MFCYAILSPSPTSLSGFNKTTSPFFVIAPRIRTSDCARAIEVYNRYRSQEATAKLLKLEKDSFIIEFEGSFCQSCGVQDYFEDFIYELEGLSSAIEIEIGEIEQTRPQSFEVKYVVKGDFSG